MVSFGLEDSYKIVYRLVQTDASSIQNLLTRIRVAETQDVSGGLAKLNLLLEATRLLHLNFRSTQY